jgi:hypothetical protein
MKTRPRLAPVLSRAWSLRFIELAAPADIILSTVPAITDFLTLRLTLLLLGGACLARHGRSRRAGKPPIPKLNKKGGRRSGRPSRFRSAR